MSGVVLNHKSRNVLALASPKITTYTHHPHLLSILGTYEPTINWVYCNYIHIYANADLVKNHWADYYFPRPYALKPSDFCEWLTIQKVQRSFLSNSRISFWDFLKHAIDEGWYVHVMLDYFHVPEASDFEKNHRIHDALIYGYDLNQNEIYANDYLTTVKYTSFSIPMDRVNSAFDDYSKACDEDHTKGCIYLYKIDEDSDYGLDLRIEDIFESLRTYLDASVLEYWKFYNCDNKKDIVFGHDIYKSLIAYLEARPKHVDTRFFNLLYEHKKIMTQRMDTISMLKQVDAAHVQSFQDIEICTQTILNFIIKYNLTSQEKAIVKAIEQLKHAAEYEYDVLSSILSS